MNWKLFIVPMILIAMMMPVICYSEQSTADFTVVDGGITFQFEILTEPSGTSNGTVKTVEQASPYHSTLKPLVIPSAVTHESKDYDVTVIGERSFRGWNIDSVTIPAKVNKIESMAFENCYEVKELHIEGTPEIGELAFSFGTSTRHAECSVYGFIPTRPVGESGDPYSDIFGEYTTVHYKDIRPDSKEGIIHIALISLGVFALLFMGRSVKVKKIKRRKKRSKSRSS